MIPPVSQRNSAPPVGGHNSGEPRERGRRAVPQLVIEINGQQRTLEPGRSYTIGRNPQSDFSFEDARVSWQHGTISFNGSGWQLDDHGSTNGTYVAGAR
ncbi:FHA domain-containing protein, partial [Streptomyces sp. FH025]|nr:FHA domain-containing protein [Streptomyces sp. FH025]